MVSLSSHPRRYGGSLPNAAPGHRRNDETFIGGKVRGKGRGFKKNKAVVVGAVQREGKIVLKVIQHGIVRTLHRFINEVTADDTEAYFTDEWAPYMGIADHDTAHETVNHSIEEMDTRGRSHEYRGERMEPLEEVHHRGLPPCIREASGLLLGRTRMAVQQSRQSLAVQGHPPQTAER